MNTQTIEQVMPESFANDDARFAAVSTRDPNADGVFYYSVSTTGIYCRPSCPSRTALRKNIHFYTSCAEAEKAGYRPCMRCKPNQTTASDHYATLVAAACRLIETAEKIPTLDELALSQNMSRFHFHRIFKNITGITPKEYAVAHRNRKVRAALQETETVADAIYDAGYESNSRFYTTSTETLGMTPSNFRSGGTNTTIKFAVGESSLGSILVARSEKGICAILIDDEADALVKDLQDRFPKATLIGDDHDFEQWIATVIGFIEAPQLGFNLPLDIQGTAFQQRVWQALHAIPLGTTVSYADIANRIGSPKAVRAVASACAANAIAVAIPCHRVVRRDGGLSGYRWGVERKRELLKREATAS
ncbi:bifunctional DNA-binding transcriptional regulator/O6-methylguanine-DNA methyltransferase Ada [Aquirhabdus sp.]|uniref:bifunctional DNA-binding transcriptional regulator/O6-methylguanine-DNA methyltransferase Ada n=1 Tax=Aquirhabdus sp. TaxID=2824160 RepID=UPI00396C9491